MTPEAEGVCRGHGILFLRVARGLYRPAVNGVVDNIILSRQRSHDSALFTVRQRMLAR